MILDLLTLFSDSQAVTVDAASTNVIDLGAPGKAAYGNIQLVRNNKGDCVPVLIQVTEDFATLTSLTVVIQGSVDEAFTSPISLATSPAIAVASLKAGYQFRMLPELPKNNIYRYIRMYYDVTGSSATAGKVTAGITPGVDAGYKG
jgi:hypothetical protein